MKKVKLSISMVPPPPFLPYISAQATQKPSCRFDCRVLLSLTSQVYRRCKFIFKYFCICTAIFIFGLIILCLWCFYYFLCLLCVIVLMTISAYSVQSILHTYMRMYICVHFHTYAYSHYSRPNNI